MKSKFIFVFIFCLFGSTIFSCIYGTCDPVPLHFEITGVESENWEYVNLDSNPFESLELGDSTHWNTFMTQFIFQANYTALSTRDFGASLLATSCSQPGEAGDIIGVDTVVVRTVFDYNENYVSGAVINDIILAKGRFRVSDTFDDFLPLENYLSENSEGVTAITFQLILAESPTTNTPFAFDLTFVLNNGEVFQHRSPLINLMR
ncbi:hypothetical protein [Marinoscillum sp.]|uniref:hypothetical protein n=1 Tax=Marinoscillum sp. TaxID=2024838 RepID=UPI003BAA6BE0